MGNILSRLLKKFINLLKLIYLINFYDNKKYIKRIKNIVSEARSKNKACVFITNVPEHGNLGDHAIYLAEKQFLEKNYPERIIIGIPTQNLKRNLKTFKSIVEKDDCFFITGGGFLGSLWKWEQRSVDCVLKNFSNNPIVIFPQTIYFAPDKVDLLIDFKNLVANCKKLEICLRDKKSYNFVKDNKIVLEEKLHFVPDIVTYLKYDIDSKERIFCFV